MSIVLPSVATTDRTTFLEIVTRVCLETGISGAGPSTLTNVKGDYLLVKNWVISAWKEIQQSEQNWRWMTESGSFLTEVNNSVYTTTYLGISSRFSAFDKDAFSIQDEAIGEASELELTYIPYEQWRLDSRIGVVPVGRPTTVTVQPNQTLALWYTPDQVYRVMYEYHKSPQILQYDDDVPELPEQYWEVIMYRAMMKVARYNAAPEIYDDAKTEYSQRMSALRYNQLPEVVVGGTLV